MTTIPLGGRPTELHSGVLNKVGGKNKNWTRRYFILKSDYCLYYYKDTSKAPLGTITLRDPKFKARRGEPGDLAWPRVAKMDCTMAIVTSHRTYFVYCMYSHEIEEWIMMLTKAREKMLAENDQKEIKPLSGSRSTSSSEVEKASTTPKVEGKTRSASLGEIPEQPDYETVHDDPAKEKDKKTTAQDTNQTPMESMYSLASSAEEKPIYEDIPGGQVLYEDIQPKEQEVYDDVLPANQDPPPTPKERVDTTQRDQQQPLYDAVNDDQPQEPLQPLYEAMEDNVQYKKGDDSSSDHEEVVDKQASAAAPSLPPRNNAPPLPPRSQVSLETSGTYADNNSLLATTPTTSESLSNGLDTHPPTIKTATPPSPAKRRTVSSNSSATPPSPSRRRVPSNSSATPPSPSRRRVPSNTSATPPSPSRRRVPSNTSATPPSPSRRRVPSDTSATPPSPARRRLSSNNSPATPPSPACRRRATPPPSDSSITPLSNSPSTSSSNSPETAITPPSPKKPTPIPRTRTAASPDTEERNQVTAESQEAQGHREQGLKLFQLQKQRLEAEDTKRRAESIRIMEGVAADPDVSPDNKVVFAETMREVEVEKQLASEERLRWERERKKLEAERMQFEEEKRRMQEEMRRMQQSQS